MAGSGGLVGRILVLGFAVVLVLVVFGRGFVSSSDGVSVEGRIEDSGVGLVELPGSREMDRVEPAASSGGSSFESGGGAYLEGVEAFGREYVEVIGETGALMHVLALQRRGLDRLSEPEAGKLAGLLSRMEDAPEAGVVTSYPEGYADCGRHMKAGAYSLRFAADAIREFNRAADARKLDEYSDLIGMHLQSVSSAKSCVADHLYPHMR